MRRANWGILKVNFGGPDDFDFLAVGYFDTAGYFAPLDKVLF